MLWLLIFFCVGVSVALLSQVLLPVPLRIYQQTQEKKAQEASKKLENLFLEIERKRITFIFIIVPLLFAGTGFFFFQNPIGAIAGATIGFVLPNIFIKIWENGRRQKFETQLLDSLLVLSGSLKAGLSLLQSLEVLVEDTAPPISQEFGLLLKEVKMGMSLEESLHRLNKRMPSEELTMLISSILVAQETGGDITKVFSRLAATMRNNRKLKDNVKTLTLQGRMQGIIMSILPFIFIWWVLTFNRQHFDILLESETGRVLLIVGAVLQTVGLFLIYKFSIIKI